jgi:hypothetical protein
MGGGCGFATVDLATSAAVGFDGVEVVEGALGAVLGFSSAVIFCLATVL